MTGHAGCVRIESWDRPGVGGYRWGPETVPIKVESGKPTFSGTSGVKPDQVIQGWEARHVAAEVAAKAAFRNPKDVRVVRDEVFDFALAMEERLKANDFKGGWDGCKLGYLTTELGAQLDQLVDALLDGDPADVVRSKAADVANFAFMIADRAGAL